MSQGNLDIGDFGYGYGFGGGITGRLAFGGIYTEQDISTGGKFDARAFYVAPEASIYGAFSGRLWGLMTCHRPPGRASQTTTYVTSKGHDPDVWLRTGWKVSF